MSTSVSTRGTQRAQQSFDSELARDVVQGLQRQPRSLPCKYLYDERGAELFARICELPEYYPTRVETAILREHGPAIAELVGPSALVVELGSGEARKTELLLSALRDPVAYVPIDICGPELERAAARIAAHYRALQVLPLHADYGGPLVLPRTARKPQRTLVFFPGSTIGNFEPLAAQRFMSRMAQLAGPGGVVLIGVDLKKDEGVLVAAYDDARGVTASFNLNLLARINRECGADFDLSAFRHHAHWNAARGRIEMLLESTREQTVHAGEASFHFAAGETITTEHCYKYSIDQFQALARNAGLAPTRTFTDREQRFSVHALLAR